MKETSKDEMPLSKSLLWILLSTLIVSGSALMGTLYYFNTKAMRLQDKQYHIVAIVQHCPQSESLKTSYLAELLDLSIDKPINLYLLDKKEAEAKLLASPLIEEGTIQKMRPGTLYIKYKRRTPIAFLGDFTNTGMDDKGNLFPFQPFFTPKRLPVFILGSQGSWGKPIEKIERLELAKHVLQVFEGIHPCLYVKQIDVSNAYTESHGQRQIVVLLSSLTHSQTIYLRLHPELYAQNIADFRLLQSKLDLSQPSMVLDFRIPQLAFIGTLHIPLLRRDM